MFRTGTDVCVLAKLPLGIFVPQFEKKETTPENFPYNPYVRDVIYVSVAMTCRGEFSFVIAAFALGEGLFTPELYSAIVFAVLLSSITSPFVLLSIIKYYNRLSEAYLAQSLLEPEEGKDGMSSLFLSIQIRSPNQWGLQETIGSVVQRLELSVVDHRSWHPRGANSTVITELYVEDNEVRVPLQKLEEFDKPIEDEAEASMRSAKALVDKRCEEIKESIGQVLGHADETRITVTWWQPHAISSRRDSVAAFAELEDTIRERIKSEANDEINAHYITAEPTTFANSLRRRRDRMITPKVGNDMWTKDDIAQKAAAADEFQPLAAAADTRGRYRYGRRRKVVSDVSGFVLLETAPTPEQHLAGFVRRENPEVTPSEGFARFHPGRMHATEEDIEEMTERNVRVRTKSDLSGFQLRRRLSGKIRTQKHVKSQSDLTGLSLKKTNSGNIKAASSSPIVIEESTEEQQRPAEEP